MSHCVSLCFTESCLLLLSARVETQRVILQLQADELSRQQPSMICVRSEVKLDKSMLNRSWRIGSFLYILEPIPMTATSHLVCRHMPWPSSCELNLAHTINESLPMHTLPPRRQGPTPRGALKSSHAPPRAHGPMSDDGL